MSCESSWYRVLIFQLEKKTAFCPKCFIKGYCDEKKTSWKPLGWLTNTVDIFWKCDSIRKHPWLSHAFMRGYASRRGDHLISILMTCDLGSSKTSLNDLSPMNFTLWSMQLDTWELACKWSSSACLKSNETHHSQRSNYLTSIQVLFIRCSTWYVPKLRTGNHTWILNPIPRSELNLKAYATLEKKKLNNKN